MPRDVSGIKYVQKPVAHPIGPVEALQVIESREQIVEKALLGGKRAHRRDASEQLGEARKERAASLGLEPAQVPGHGHVRSRQLGVGDADEEHGEYGRDCNDDHETELREASAAFEICCEHGATARVATQTKVGHLAHARESRPPDRR